MRRPVAALLAVVAIVLVTAPPAAGAAARPGDEETILTSVPAGVSVSVTDDGVVTLQAAPGHRVVVADYAGAPWHELSDGATHTWHDHRAHWMGSGPGTPGGAPGLIVAFTIPLEVDGRPAELRGEIWRRSAPFGWPAVLVGVGAAVVAVVLGRRRPLFGGAVVVAAAGGGALSLTVASAAAVGPELLGIAVPLLAAGAAAAGAVALAAHTPDGRGVASLVAGVAVGGWAIARVPVVARAVGTTDLPLAVERVATSATLGLALAGVVLTVWSGHPRLEVAPTGRGGAGRGRTARAASPG